MKNIEWTSERSSLLLSLLLHIFLLLSFTLVWVGHVRPVEKPPSMYVPSYTYQEQTSQPSAFEQPKQSQPPKKLVADKSGFEKETISTSTQIRHATQTGKNTSTKVTEAINLVGDKKTVPKPLIKLLGKALAAHLVYPKIAIDFRVRGMAFVGFVLHPDGTLSNVELVQSSKAGVLDDEAVAAVSAISPVKNVNAYVDKPKEMVVGIIFD